MWKPSRKSLCASITSSFVEVGENGRQGFGPEWGRKTTLIKQCSVDFEDTRRRLIEVAGFDAIIDPQEVKRRIDLPEHCPYLDMRVDEFLAYRATIKGVLSRRIRDRLQQ